MGIDELKEDLKVARECFKLLNELYRKTKIENETFRSRLKQANDIIDGAFSTGTDRDKTIAADHLMTWLD